jgi:hypothetical protein
MDTSLAKLRSKKESNLEIKLLVLNLNVLGQKALILQTLMHNGMAQCNKVISNVLCGADE